MEAGVVADDDWVQAALKDASLVAETLLGLSKAKRRAVTTVGGKRTEEGIFKLDWSVRQRRTKMGSRESKAEPTRASPTTPLSWSAATSLSGGGGGSGSGAAVDGCEESSRPQAKAMDATRSKFAATSEATTSKKSKKKKTLAELKEEESLLLEEKIRLKRELATLRFTVEEQRATNESLKRAKIDLLSRQATKTVATSVASMEAISDHPQKMEITSDPPCPILPTAVPCTEPEPSAPNSSSKVQEVGSIERSFLLPDLNIPVDDGSGSEDLYGTS